MKFRWVAFLSVFLFGIGISLSQAETLKVGLYAGGSPPLFFDKSQAESGIYKDILEEVGRRTGIRFDYDYYPAKRVMVLFDDGQIDLEAGINPAWRQEVKQPGLYSKAFGNSDDVAVFMAANIRPVHSATDLAGMRVGTMKGFYYPGFMEAFSKGSVLRKDSVSEEQLLKKLISGRLDTVFMRREAVQYRMKIDKTYRDLKIGDVIGRAAIHFRLHPSKKASLSKIDSAIEAMLSDGAIDTIYAKYR